MTERSAAEAMREAAAQKAERLFDCVSRGDGRTEDMEDIVARDAGIEIASSIRAIPLPAPSEGLEPRGCPMPGACASEALSGEVDKRDTLLTQASEALRPFARAAEVMPLGKREARDGDDFVLWSYQRTHDGSEERAVLTGPHIRRAAKALAAIDAVTKPKEARS